MNFFKHKTSNTIICTNLKVMFSSLLNNANVEQIDIDSASSKVKVIIKIMRCPEKRLVSAYKDKFQQHPANVRNMAEWQDSQKIFFPYLEIDINTASIDQIKTKLMSVSFDQFMEILPKVYHRDHHFKPQIGNAFIALFFKFFRFRRLKMESEADLRHLANLIDLDLKIKKNNTDAVTAKTLSLTETVKSIYLKDAIWLGDKEGDGIFTLSDKT